MKLTLEKLKLELSSAVQISYVVTKDLKLKKIKFSEMNFDLLISQFKVENFIDCQQKQEKKCMASLTSLKFLYNVVKCKQKIIN